MIICLKKRLIIYVFILKICLQYQCGSVHGKAMSGCTTVLFFFRVDFFLRRFFFYVDFFYGDFFYGNFFTAIFKYDSGFFFGEVGGSGGR